MAMVESSVSVRIVVNGRDWYAATDNTALTYESVTALAGYAPGQRPSVTVKPKGRDGRILQPGYAVQLEEGMVFNVYDTSNA